MSRNLVVQALGKMDPEEALDTLAQAVKSLFPVLDREARLNFLVKLLGDAGGDKVSSMVHL